MRLPFPRKLEREKKAVSSCFFFCRISIPMLLHTDPGLRGVPSWKRWTSKVSVLHSSNVKCPFDGNEGAQGWPILQKTKKLCWPSLLSFPLHVPSPLFSLLLYLLWLFDNAPPKNVRYSSLQLREWLSVYEQVCVRLQRDLRVCVLTSGLGSTSVSCGGTRLCLTVTLCVFMHWCVFMWVCLHCRDTTIIWLAASSLKDVGSSLGVASLAWPHLHLVLIHSCFPSSDSQFFPPISFELGLQQRWKWITTQRLPSCSKLNKNILIPCCTIEDALSFCHSIYTTWTHSSAVLLSLSLSIQDFEMWS